MTSVEIKDENVIIHVDGIDKLLAFKGSVTIPLAHVSGVAMNTEPLMDYRHAAFGIGTIFAGRIQTGTFKEEGQKSFWDVRDPKKAIVITLKDETYGKLIIGVEDLDKTVDLMKSRLS